MKALLEMILNFFKKETSLTTQTVAEKETVQMPTSEQQLQNTQNTSEFNLVLHRIYKKEDHTCGKLYYLDNNGEEQYICYILEDTVRNPKGTPDDKFTKVYGETAIGYGKYQIVRTMSPRLKYVLPELLNVPNFTGIRIHKGNSATDSLGCLICGTTYSSPKVLQSKVAFDKLDEMIKKALDDGKKVWISIDD